MFSHVFYYLLDCDINSVFYDSFIDVSDDALNHSKLLKQLPACIKHFLRKDVLFSIYPQVREAFLSWIKNLSQVTKTAFLVQDFVSFGKLLPITSMRTVCFEYFAQAFYLVQESFTGSLAIFWV